MAAASQGHILMVVVIAGSEPTRDGYVFHSNSTQEPVPPPFFSLPHIAACLSRLKQAEADAGHTHQISEYIIAPIRILVTFGGGGEYSEISWEPKQNIP